MPERRTREGVEIARVGRYELSTGAHEFTRAQLAAAVANAQTQAPVIGIGHIDPRFNIPGQDGDPAFGRIVNLRLAEDGDLLVGDFDGVPDWLDDSMEIAYPRRSLEGRALGDDLRLSSVKLLGTTLPGIKGLADLPAVLAASAAQGGSVEEQARRATGVLVAASTNIDDLRDAFSGDHPYVDENDWWMVSEVQINPNQLIVEHRVSGQDTTYRVPWSVDQDGTFTFGDMQEVVVKYVDVAAAAGDHAVVYKAPGSRPTPPQREESIVDPKTLREQLGLAVDASDEDVTAKLTELAARPTPQVVSEQVAAKAAELAATEIAAAAAKNPTAEHLAALQADALAGREAKTALDNQERESFLAAAMGDGKLPPAAKDGYLQQLQQGGAIETATREFISGLPKNTVPVTEIGASIADDDGPIIESTGWFTPAQLGIKQEVA